MKKDRDKKPKISGIKIKVRREEIGLSPKEFAEEVGVNRETIFSWEGNKTRPCNSNLKKCSDILGVKIDELYDTSHLSSNGREYYVIEVWREKPAKGGGFWGIGWLNTNASVSVVGKNLSKGQVVKRIKDYGKPHQYIHDIEGGKFWTEDGGEAIDYFNYLR